MSTAEDFSRALFEMTTGFLLLENMITEIPKTTIDIYRALPEGTRCEVVDGILTMLPPNTSDHQLTLSSIASELHVFLKQTQAGKVIPSPMDVYFDNSLSVVQPDILVVLNIAGILLNLTAYMAPLT